MKKIETLSAWLLDRGHLSDATKIMVDGGINGDTCKRVREAGATILVAGSFLFGHSSSLAEGVEELLA